MTSNYNRDKIIDCMFDPVTSSILADLEDSGKKSGYLAEKFAISQEEIHSKLSYLIQHDFIIEKETAGEKFYSANGEKLASIVENNDNFDATIDGLTKLDGYLN